MSFWGTIGQAAGWLDKNLGTTVFGSTAVTAANAATGFYNRNIAGTFLEDVGSKLAVSVGTQAVAGAVGGQQAGYQVPLPQARQISGRSGVSAGRFTASQARKMGLDNPRVQDAYRRAATSQNRQIAAALAMVRPRTVQRGPTKSLSEAQIGTRRS